MEPFEITEESRAFWGAISLSAQNGAAGSRGRSPEWDAGDSVDELIDGTHVYVRFAEAEGTAPPDAMELPAGFSYASRVLEEPFVLEPVPRVVVFLHLTHQHLWQRVQPPE